MNTFVLRLEQGAARQRTRQPPLSDVLGDLDPLHQRFIALKFFKRLSTPEIARVLGCSEDTVRLLQYQALSALDRRVRP